jgi:hypothetical protein
MDALQDSWDSRFLDFARRLLCTLADFNVHSLVVPLFMVRTISVV